ncbi:HNH endonuclease [Halarchaeum rubridurum]
MSNEFSGEDSWNWTGGGSLNYGSNWLRQRERALRRDQYRCQECGITAPTYRAEAGRGLDVHHRTPLREFRAGDTIDHEAGNDLSNLVALCRPCHRRAERNL